MLDTSAVAPELLSLLVRLQSEAALEGFNLVGGTALALQLGHRRSLDIDLFSTAAFDSAALLGMLQQKYALRRRLFDAGSIVGDIAGIKVDLLRHPYPLLQPPLAECGVRCCQLLDIAAMKLSAIADNGTRLKDFVDVACLSTRLCLREMLEAYLRKFPGVDALCALRGLSYYADVDFSAEVQLLSGTFAWERYATRLEAMVRDQRRVWREMP